MTVEPQKRNRNVSFLSHPSFLVVIPTCHVWTRMIKRLPTPPGRQWLLLGEGCLKPRPSVVPLFHRRSLSCLFAFRSHQISTGSRLSNCCYPSDVPRCLRTRVLHYGDLQQWSQNSAALHILPCHLRCVQDCQSDEESDLNENTSKTFFQPNQVPKPVCNTDTETSVPSEVWGRCPGLQEQDWSTRLTTDIDSAAKGATQTTACV